MRIGVLGGRLQGIEAAYLCRKAGYESVLIDKDAQAPALALANEAYILDITKDVNYAKRILKKVDAVLPANENKKALAHSEKLCMKLGIPFMQDNAAFWTTSDKLRSGEFLLDLNIPGMGGREFLRQIKYDKGLKQIPVVILTTSNSERDIVDSFKLQAAGYVHKPLLCLR